MNPTENVEKAELTFCNGPQRIKEPDDMVSGARRYKDSTPNLHVGDSSFEDWFQAQPFACQVGIKQMCRDSYAAGMGDPLVTSKTEAM